MKLKSLLSDGEAELLAAFEGAPSIDALAEVLGRDSTVISKQLKRISEKVPALCKVGGRWQLTDQGRRLNQLTREYVLAQHAATEKRLSIRIGSNREFGSRILSRDIQSFLKAMGPCYVTLKLYESGIENALLEGQIDLGFDCGKPYSPEIAYRLIVEEPILPVISPRLAKSLKLDTKNVDLAKIPHIFCDRLKPDRVMREELHSLEICIASNDIGSTREMCVQGIGWAMLPKYAIQPELKNKSLIPLGTREFRDEKYGVWYLRERNHLKPYFEVACEWLKEIDF